MKPITTKIKVFPAGAYHVELSNADNPNLYTHTGLDNVEDCDSYAKGVHAGQDLDLTNPAYLAGVKKAIELHENQ